MRSILTGAISGAAFASLGTARFANPLQKAVSFGVTSVVQGGNFQSGFLAAGFSSIATPAIDEIANDNIFVGAAASAVAGGAGSVLGGGKFQNGAITGAFAYATGRVIEGLDRAPSNQYAANDNGVVCDACTFDQDFNDAIGKDALNYNVQSEICFESGLCPYVATILSLGAGGAVAAVARLGGKGLQLLSAARVASAARTGALTVDANRLAHIFGQARHNLAPLVQRMGSQEAAFTAVQNATQAAVRNQRLSGIFETTVSVAGQNVVVRGNVIDGTARIGTFFIP